MVDFEIMYKTIVDIAKSTYLDHQAVLETYRALINRFDSQDETESVLLEMRRFLKEGYLLIDAYKKVVG